MNSVLRITLLNLLAVSVFAAASKKSADLSLLPPDQPVDVIIQYKVKPGATQLNRLQGYGAAVKGELGLIRAVVARLTPRLLRNLEADTDIVYMTPDRRLAPTLYFSRAASTASIAQDYGWTGQGVGVAIIDSGLTSHSELNSSQVYKQSLIDGTADDGYGHGTHVAGIVAGNGSSYDGYQNKGIAPQARIVSLKVLDANGNGTDSGVIAAIDRAVQLKSQYNIRVINLSLGRPVRESYKLDPLCQAVERAWQAGIVVVVAAGNEGRNNTQGTDGYGTILAPGNDPLVITVGAMKAMNTAARGDDQIASYSSKGPTALDQVVKPDLVAPGNQVVSTMRTNTTLWNNYPDNRVIVSDPVSQYFRLSGTSMAAPAVSGAVALMLQKDPSLTPDQVKARLMKTATKSFPASTTTTDPATGLTYTSYYDSFTVGAGYLDIWAALNNNDAVSGSAQSPSAVYDSKKKTVTMVMPTGVVWGTGVTWGTGIVWGTANVSSTGVCWGTGVVWGTSTTSGTGIVWGTGVTWGTDDTGETASALGEK